MNPEPVSGKVIREFKEDCLCPVWITSDPDGTLLIEFQTPSGFCLVFNAEWIPEDNLEWFASVLSRQLVEYGDRIRKDTQKEIRERFQSFLSGFGVEYD